MWKNLKRFFIEILFPYFCVGCKKEGGLLCQDCFSIIEIFENPPKINGKYLDRVFVATDYNQALIRKMILAFKYPPFIRDLCIPLSQILLVHLAIAYKEMDLEDSLLIPIPLDQKRMKWRGYNQSEEIAKRVSEILKVSMPQVDVLAKIKKTPPQVTLSEKQRRENVKDSFKVIKPKMVADRRIILIDDVFTTGATMEECARILKESGAKSVIGVAVAIANPGDDRWNF